MVVETKISNETLTEFFYKKLDKVNKKSLCPLPQEFMLYSSEVLNQYALTQNFFNTKENGEVSQKVLGVNLLEAFHRPEAERKRIFKDVGDSVLVQLGFFKTDQAKRAPSRSYYLQLGRSAYNQMESLDCRFYDIPNFYKQMATSLDSILKVIKATSESLNFKSLEEYLLDGSHNSDLFLNFQNSDKAS